MSLTEELTKTREESRAKMPPEVRETMERTAQELLQSGIADQSLKVGDTAPEFTLPNALEKPVALKDFLARGPVVLSFYRGGW